MAARPAAAARAPRAGARAGAREATARLEYHGLLLLTLTLVAFGLIAVYSATSGVAVLEGADPLGVLYRQGAYAALGIGLMAAAARVPYRRLRPLVPALLLVSLVLLVAVMAMGVLVNGARRWLILGPVSVQPSELAKLAVLLFTAAVLASRREPPSTVRALVSPLGLVTLVVCGLVVEEPDLGTAIAIAIMVSGIVVVAGAPYRLLGGSATVLGAAAALMIYQESFRRARLLAFLNPWQDPTGSGYQNAQALIALGSGGIWGKGLGNGTQKIAYLPEAPSDMIAAVIGEELGLIGTVVTALAFALFAFVGFRIALRCRDPFGRYLVAGATCLVTGQAAVNLGAVLGLVPLTGVPLPFISTGGSSLVVFLVIVGIMLNVAESSSGAGAAEATPRSRPRRRVRAVAEPATEPAPAPRRRSAGARTRSSRTAAARATGAAPARRRAG